MNSTRKIGAQLRREGVLITRKTVQRHMREMGIVAVYPGPNLSRRHHKEHVFPYLLRNLTIRAPNHVWGIDITYIRMLKKWMYLVAVLDWYSRYVISWELDHTLEMPFVLTAVERALSTAIPVIWNSDQGSHFTSPHYLQLLQDAHIQDRKSTRLNSSHMSISYAVFCLKKKKKKIKDVLDIYTKNSLELISD